MNEEKAVYQVAVPVTDLSPKVVRLARAIDRLPPGTHHIVLEKPFTGDTWTVTITIAEFERQMNI